MIAEYRDVHPPEQRPITSANTISGAKVVAAQFQPRVSPLACPPLPTRRADRVLTSDPPEDRNGNGRSRHGEKPEPMRGLLVAHDAERDSRDHTGACQARFTESGPAEHCSFHGRLTVDACEDCRAFGSRQAERLRRNDVQVSSVFASRGTWRRMRTVAKVGR